MGRGIKGNKISDEPQYQSTSILESKGEGKG